MFEQLWCKKNRTGDGYEVVLTKRSAVFSSPKKFKIDEDMTKKVVKCT